MKHIALVVLCACTSLGPMPATTGVSPIPAGRPGFEAQAGAVPAFFLSTSAQDKSGGTHVNQFSLLFDPDRWLGVPGLIVGTRLFGTDQDTLGEPYIGYRHKFDDTISVAGIAYGTAKRSTKDGASYHATRAGLEGSIDGTLWAPSPWFSAHVGLTVSATRIFASGTYCGDPDGKAIACDQDLTMNTVVSGDMTGIFPAATGIVAFESARLQAGMFHGARLAVMLAMGRMPLVRNGMKEATDFYTSGGLTLTLGLGAR